MFDYGTLSIVLTGIGLMVAVTYYGLEIRNQNRTRRAQLYMQIFGRISTIDFRLSTAETSRWEYSDFEDFVEKYLMNSDPSYIAKWQALMSWMEGIGYLLKDGLIDAEDLYNLSGGQGVILFWKKWEPIVYEYRVSRKNEDFGRWFEYLGEKMIEFRKSKRLPAIWSPEEKKFLEE